MLKSEGYSELAQLSDVNLGELTQLLSWPEGEPALGALEPESWQRGQLNYQLGLNPRLCVGLPNTYLIYELLEPMKGLVLRIHRCRISATWANGRPLRVSTGTQY